MRRSDGAAPSNGRVRRYRSLLPGSAGLKAVVETTQLSRQLMPPDDLILFLCTGNYYRSRYAEEVFNFHARAANLSWRAFSRGLAEASSPENVGPMSRFARDALERRMITPEGKARFPAPCLAADFDRASLIIALKEIEHRPMVERRFPQLAGRIEYWDVDDIEFAPPEIALAMIDREVEELIRRLRQGTGPVTVRTRR